MKSLGLYLHIPFCRSKCLYCDFCSFPHPDPARMRAYTDALCRELILRAPDCKDHTVDTVYLGGGTPTVLPIDCLERILNTVFFHYRISKDAECTAECNPATADRALLSRLYSLSINRLSLGVQSVHVGELRALGRLHTLSDVEKTVDDARQVGFQNLSFDVMFGIPQQTEQSYLGTLDTLCALSPTHLSAYGLTVEEGTPFGKKQREGRLLLPDEEEVERMYFSGRDYLARQGYAHYEISNFAKEGYESRHNLKYWNCDEYLGFGVAAYSDFSGARFGNSRDAIAYIEGREILEELETVSLEERKNEYVMLRMRLARGISAADFESRFNEPLERRFGASLRRYIEGGFVRRTENGYAFTPKGWYVSNAILSEILDFSSK